MRMNVVKFALALFVMTLSGALMISLAADDNAEVPNLRGKWKYQSYRPEQVSLTSDTQLPQFTPFSPYGLGEVTIDDGGNTGTLVFKGTQIKLDLKIKVTTGNPAKVAISAEMKLPMNEKFTNELEGWLTPATLGQKVGTDNPRVVRGAIVQTSKDIAMAPQPIFTTGFFVLEPIKEPAPK